MLDVPTHAGLIWKQGIVAEMVILILRAVVLNRGPYGPPRGGAPVKIALLEKG